MVLGDVVASVVESEACLASAGPWDCGTAVEEEVLVRTEAHNAHTEDGRHKDCLLLHTLEPEEAGCR